MSEDIKDSLEAGSDGSDFVAGEDASSQLPLKVEARIVNIHGKEFDLSTPEGLMQAQAVYDVMSSVIGRQGNELGQLRKFVKEGASPAKSDLYKAAKAKASEGDVEGAIETVLSFAEETQRKADKKLEVERENSKAWDAYLDSRKALADVFGKSAIREVSETVLKDRLYDADDPFKLLDEYWLPKVSKISLATPEDAPSVKSKPLATLSSGRARPQAITTSPAPVATMEDEIVKILDSRKIKHKRSTPK